MNSIRATGLFASTFALRGLADALGAKESSTSVLVGLVALTTVAALAFWLGTRNSTYRWLTTALAGFVAFAITSFLLLSLPSPSRWTFLGVAVAATALVSFLLARTFGKLPTVTAQT